MVSLFHLNTGDRILHAQGGVIAYRITQQDNRRELTK